MFLRKKYWIILVDVKLYMYARWHVVSLVHSASSKTFVQTRGYVV